MNEILRAQLALDYCCGKGDVSDGKNHFMVHREQEGQRRYEERGESHLKIAVVGGKLLFAGEEAIVEWCRRQYEKEGGAWFFDMEHFRKIDRRLAEDGYEIKQARPYYISDRPGEAGACAGEIRWYEGDEIDAFRGDARFKNAFTYVKEAPDVLGVAALEDGEIIGMAGASADSPAMWQIGIDVMPEKRRSGVAKTLVSLLRNKILEKGRLAYYSTGASHIASQRVAIGSGFELAWGELYTARF